MTAKAFMRLAYWILFQRFFEYSLLKSSQASYLPASPAMVDQCFVFTRSWSTVVGFAVWEVGCLRAVFNASGRVCHRCVHRATSFKA
jgi:hypothetical protein